MVLQKAREKADERERNNRSFFFFFFKEGMMVWEKMHIGPGQEVHDLGSGGQIWGNLG